MKVNKILLCFYCFCFFSVFAAENNIPQFSDYPVNLFFDSFAKKINLSNQQKNYSLKWKESIQNALLKPANFSGHYVIFISKKGELPEECGNDGWVCGWIIDKINGEVVSELPNFNGNTKYYSTIDNGTPSPDLFDVEFYVKSSMLWVRGQNTPINEELGEVRCANTAYNFKSNLFVKLFSGKCAVDVGSDPYADHYLP
ncbi:hypothetical protein DB992_06005 [Salmonella enterica]|nr:hypothetical protein [Salmonella enterica]EBN4819863.1 hypothetical protein [Salmonella enterica]